MSNTKFQFIGFSVKKTINLTLIFIHFKKQQKTPWQDAIILDENELKSILATNTCGKFVSIYKFSSIVFVNFTEIEIDKFIKYFDGFEKNMLEIQNEVESEEYLLIIDEKIEKNNILSNQLIIDSFSIDIISIISEILAKSVSLDRVDRKTNLLSLQMELIIEKLKNKNLKIKNLKIYETIAEILKFKQKTISGMKIFEKSVLTWEDDKINHIYEKLFVLFELNGRYKSIMIKLESLLETINIFNSLAREDRSEKLEIAVVVLIFVELIIILLPLFIHGKMFL